MPIDYPYLVFHKYIFISVCITYRLDNTGKLSSDLLCGHFYFILDMVNDLSAYLKRGSNNKGREGGRHYISLVECSYMQRQLIPRMSRR